MRGLVALLLCCAASLHSQGLKILPPALDSSGQKIFFGTSLTADGLLDGTEVYSIDASGAQRLTHVAVSNQSVTDFAVSDDGQQLAYSALIAPGSMLAIVDLNTGASHSFSFPPNPSRPGSVHIVQSSKKIIFDLFGSPSPHTPAFGAPIYSANTDGTGLTVLHRGALAPAPQRVASNTGLIVFTSADPFYNHALPQPPANVYVMNADGTNVQQVTHYILPPEGVSAAPIAKAASISSAGDLIVFETFSGTAPGAPSQIWTISPDGSNLVPITQAAETCDSPALSSDGTKVAFVCKGQIFLAGRDGTGRRQLTHFRFSSASSPVISADGSRVFFTIGPVSEAAVGIYGPMQQDSYARGAIWSVKTDGTSLAPVYTPRFLTPGGVVDAVSYTFLFPPAGGLITVFGTNFSTDTMMAAAATAAAPLPESLNGVQLLVNGQPAPLLAVTPWQINAQLPPDMLDGPAKFEIQFADGSRSNPVQQEVRQISPNMLTIPSADQSNCQDAVFHAGSGIPADAQHPAAAGETIEIYATGLGPTKPQVRAGMIAPASPPALLRYPAMVLVGGMPAAVEFAGLAPGEIGIYQVNATMPAGLVSGRQQVTLSVSGGTLFTNACFFWVD